MSAACVTHWGVKPGSGRTWDAAATVGAVLGHGARRGGAYRPNWGGRKGVKRTRVRVFREREPKPGLRGDVSCCGISAMEDPGGRNGGAPAHAATVARVAYGLG